MFDGFSDILGFLLILDFEFGFFFINDRGTKDFKESKFFIDVLSREKVFFRSYVGLKYRSRFLLRD